MRESMQVFVGLNHLEHRFRALADYGSFRIGELGFGTGLNFICAAERFLAEAPGHARMHFVSVEKHPLTFHDLRRAAHQHPALQPHYDELIAGYPAPVPGWHRLQLFHGRISLSVYYGEARAALASLVGAAMAPMDCWFLDGFAPDKNPDMWEEPLLAALAGLSAGGTTLATFSAAGRLRRTLERLGFRVERVSGAPRKRHLLTGQLQGKPVTRPDPLSVAVIGAGIAGASAARALAIRGHRVCVIAPATRESGDLSVASENPAAALHPRLLPNTQPLSRLRTKAFEYASAYYRGVSATAPQAPFWHPTGLAQLPGPNTPLERIDAIAETFSNCHWLLKADATTLSSFAGRPLVTSGLWFPRSGWLDLHVACECLLAHPGIMRIAARATHFHQHDGWRIATTSGDTIESDQLVVAAGPQANTLPVTSALPLATIAGQLTHFSCRDHGLRCVVSGDGYVAPLSSHHLVAGATYVREGYESLPDAAGRDANRTRLHSMLGDIGSFELGADFAGLRTTSRDRRPLVGTLAPGLHVSLAHASHGAVMAPLAAEIIAGGIDREPPPLDAEELALLDPLRFGLR